MTHVKTSPYYPQSNGKIERWHKSLKQECIRPKAPSSLEDGCYVVTGYVDEYNNRRRHSAHGYIAPVDKLEGRAKAIFEQRQAKIHAAKIAREQAYLDAKDCKKILNRGIDYSLTDGGENSCLR
jgi:putative transposase